MSIVLRYDGDGLKRFSKAVDELGSEKRARSTYSMALNKVGRHAFVQTKRALAKQTGMKGKRLVEKGALVGLKASPGNLAYRISSTGKPLSLKEFGAKQFGYGVKASPWNRSQRFEGAFIWAGANRSGKFVGNGHVFARTSGKSTPIKKLWGPSIPKEMVKDESAKAFTKAAEKLGPEIERTIRKRSEGVIREAPIDPRG